MKKISLRLPDTTLERIEIHRGDKTVSEYIRVLIDLHHRESDHEAAVFQSLIHDINMIKEILNTSIRNFTVKKDILALSGFIAEVSSFANPPAYSHHKTEIQHLYQTLASAIQNEE